MFIKQAQGIYSYKTTKDIKKLYNLIVKLVTPLKTYEISMKYDKYTYCFAICKKLIKKMK